MNINTRILSHIQRKESICAGIQNFYVKKVRELFLFLHKRQWSFVAAILATFLIEPHNAFRAAYLMHKGLDRKFTNLNPQRLSTQQLQHEPVLLIHGDASNSGLFAPLVDQMTVDFPNRPIFTIDLASADGIVSEKNHLQLLVAKVKEITTLYSSKSPKISFVGHSSGGDILGALIKVMHAQKLALPGAIIKIGSIFKETEANEFIRYGKVVEIVGTKDVFEGSQSHVPNQLVVNSGHLGLLFNSAVLKHVSNEM